MSFSVFKKVIQSSDGGEIFAEAIGDPTNPSIVLAHGLCCDGSAFDNLFADKRLLQRLYMVRYDTRGQGRSTQPKNPEAYVSSLYADDFMAVVRAFDLHKPVFVGWSLGATVAADICAHLDPLPISAIVYVAGLPYIGEAIIKSVGTATILRIIPGLMCTDDVVLNWHSKIEFVDTLYLDPSNVPWSVKSCALGSAARLHPVCAQLILSRPQDPTKLLEVGKKGLPIFFIHGKKDMQVDGEATVKAIKPHYKNSQVHVIEGGSHALAYDFQDEFVENLLAFVLRVTVGNVSISTKITQ